MEVNGILLVDKPADWTSHDVVAKARAILKAETGQKIKVGHTGTLDPMATGLLVLVLGNYTKRAGEFSKLDKVYEAELTLGATSTTGDKEGKITKKRTEERGHRGEGRPSKREIKVVLNKFMDEIEQTPPAHSAIKVGGQRAYKLARKGQNVGLEPRKVTVHRLQVTEYRYPKLKLVAEVSSGTYIRSLAEDIGAKLGTGAYLSALRRTQVGKFKLEDAVTVERLSAAKIGENLQSN